MWRFTDQALPKIALIAVCSTGFMGEPATAAEDSERDPSRVSLSRQLLDLARRSGAELVYDEELVRSHEVRPVPRGLAAEAALRSLLSGTGLSFRRTSDGSFIIYRTRVPALAESPEAIPEILVIGRRSQNVDIPRTENDIQSYKVVTRRDLQTAHRDNLDVFLRSRMPANADMLSPMQDIVGQPGASQSRVDLRGIGSRRTLVLVDGRRMPSLPSSTNDFEQSDLNGIPLGAIERVEVLTSTSGGIFGSGALGGTVNVVLRHDYEGAEFTATSGLSTRGDAETQRIEGRIGLSTSDGATGLMIYGAFSKARPLRFRDRDFVLLSRQTSAANNPSEYLFPRGFRSRVPQDGTVFVASSSGSPLVFDADKGGATLSNSFTFLPIGFVGNDAERMAELTKNAGKAAISLGPGYSGEDRSLMSTPTVHSTLLTARHRFANELELYLDGIYYRNHGEERSAGELVGIPTLADAPSNPFNESVIFSFPVARGGRSQVSIDVFRLVGGVIVPLPRQWKGVIEFAAGRSRYHLRQEKPSLTSLDYLLAIMSGSQRPNGLPALNPLGDWQAFQSTLSPYFVSDRTELRMTNRFSNASVRLAGPVAHLAGGPLALTLLGEQRTETIKPSKTVLSSLPIDLWTPYRALRATSAYSELRAPLVSFDSASLLRGLEVQIAARFDRTRAKFPENANAFERDQPLTSFDRDALMFTGGMQVFPLPNLMLRTSYATGTVTPDFNRFQSREQTGTTGTVLDEKRGQRRLGSEGVYTTKYGGSRDVKQERGRTLSLGAVLNPRGGPLPRLSVDYSRISLNDQIEDFLLSAEEIIVLESRYPNRVIRAPLTDDDRAAGFSAGRIITVDVRAGNTGRTVVHALDFQFDWQVNEVLGGKLSPYAKVTWQPSIKSTSLPGISNGLSTIAAPRSDKVERVMVERVGFIDGPLEWRGVGGIGWQRGRLALDVNMQYYAGYSVTFSDPEFAPASAQNVAFNGRSRVPAQAYFDLAISWSSETIGLGPVQRMDVRFGVTNILDKSPPILAIPNTAGYSTYGDPRGRRIELATTIRF